MITDEEPGDEMARLVGDYADGQLDSEQARRLLELIESSPDARARLAEGVVVERLLRALGKGAVPTARIMEAVVAERDRAMIRPPAHRPAGRSWPVWCVVVILLIIAGVVASIFRPPSPRRPVAPSFSPVSAPVVPPVPPVPSVPPAVTTPAPVPSAPEPPPVPAAPVRPLFPLELPPPPADLPAAPAGDGSGEPGYIAPPADWQTVRVAAPDDHKKPEPPLLWVKINLADANNVAAPNELRPLVAALQDRLALRFGCAQRALGEMDADPARNPVLFFSTHHRFSFTADQRTLLRRYLLTGGMVVFNAAMGSAPAYDSARRELRLILPELPIQRLGGDHPVFHSYYEPGPATNGPARWFEGVMIACRTAVLISRWDLAAGWAGHRADTAYAPEEALRLGINLSSYATAVRAWSRQAAAGAAYPAEAESAGDRLFVAQVEYDGEWRTRYAAFPILLHAFNQRTEVPVKLGVRTMRLTDARLFHAPLLYLTGHEPLALGPEEIQALKRYLENGGFLFAEACCGRRSFDRSFRALMQQVLPGQALERIPEDAALFQSPNHIDALGLTPSLAAKVKSQVLRPQLEGIRVGAAYGVVYSPFGLAGAWEGTPMPYADGYADPAALKLGQNILFQAITQ